jgi:hypothetical protein
MISAGCDAHVDAQSSPPALPQGAPAQLDCPTPFAGAVRAGIDLFERVLDIGPSAVRSSFTSASASPFRSDLARIGEIRVVGKSRLTSVCRIRARFSSCSSEPSSSSSNSVGSHSTASQSAGLRLSRGDPTRPTATDKLLEQSPSAGNIRPPTLFLRCEFARGCASEIRPLQVDP